MPPAGQASAARKRPESMSRPPWSRSQQGAIRLLRSSRRPSRTIPFTDESFDAAVGNIVIQHVGEPERAAREIARVLVPGGRIALSTWDAPERSPFFAALLGAVADAQVPPPSEIPPGPSFFEYANDDAFRSLLRTAGFVQVSVGMTTIEFSLDSADDLITALADGTVRTGALLRRPRGAASRRT